MPGIDKGGTSGADRPRDPGEHSDQSGERRRRHWTEITQEELDADAEHTRHYSSVRRSRPQREPTDAERAQLEATYGRSWQEMDRLRRMGTDRWSAETADQIATFRAKPGGDGKAQGDLINSDGERRSLMSGEKGPASDVTPSTLGTPSWLPANSHVEAHAAAVMHQTGERHSTLYVNRRPCPGKWGCDTNLSTMVPRDGTMQTYYIVDEKDPPIDRDTETGPWTDSHGRQWRAKLYLGYPPEQEDR